MPNRLDKNFEATLIHDIHVTSVYSQINASFTENIDTEPFQKLAQIFVGLQVKIFKPREFYSIEIFAVQSGVDNHATCKNRVFYRADIALTSVYQKAYINRRFILFDVILFSLFHW